MREMDYSVIDEGEGGARNEGFIQQDVDTKDWIMPEQGKVSVHLNPNLEGSLLQKHHVWIVVSNNAVCFPFFPLPFSFSRADVPVS